MSTSTHSREQRCGAIVAAVALVLGLTFLTAACGVGAAVGDGGAVSTAGSPQTTLSEPDSSLDTTTTSETSGPDTSGPATTSTSATGGGTSAATAAPGTKDTVTVNFYFMRGEEIAPASQAVAKTQSVGAAAVQLLLAGPGDVGKEAGMTTAIPVGTKLLGLDIKNGIATVDLSKEYASGGGSLSMMMRLAQVVFTLTQFPSVQGVNFMLDGKAIDVLGGEGLIIDHPMTRADYKDLCPAILVESPTVGATLARPVRITGTANVFEAVFRINIVDRDGLIIADETVKATSGTGTRGTFDVTLAYPSGHAGKGSLIVFENSAKDGSPTNVVEIPVVLE
jgi:hypothetical protein